MDYGLKRISNELFCSLKGMLEEVRLSYQDQLIDCIMWVLVSNPDLHYYQVPLRTCNTISLVYFIIYKIYFAIEVIADTMLILCS